jgi:NAD(P)-dependent dehydrogenase (short-subunit alcohol dehydrogenase family)
MVPILQPTATPLQGRVAVVTGSADGVGRGIAEALLEAGAKVLLAGRRAAVHETARDLAVGGYEVDATQADIRDAESCAALMGTAVERFGCLDILVNNAASPRFAKPLLELTGDDWNDHLQTNVVGTFLALRAGAEQMIRGGLGGRILNISTIAAQRPLLYRAHYSASKAAVEALTQTAALELADHGITVNAIAPGMITTEASAAARSGPGKGADADYLWQLRHRSPARRMGTVAEIGAAAVFLASPAAAYITGQVLAVDGGITVGYAAQRLPEGG